VSRSLHFAEPIVLPDGDTLASLRQAIAHLIQTVPPAERHTSAVLTAAMLTAAAEHRGPVEFARIATLQALNRHAVRVFNPARKETKWGAESWRAADDGQVSWLRSRRHHRGRHLLFWELLGLRGAH
jgi:hypothetical protein